MVKEISTVLESVEVLNVIGPEVAHCEVIFSCSEDKCIITGDPQDFKALLGCQVLVSFRQELFSGVFRQVVNSITKITHVTTLSAETDFKLFSTDIPDTESNVIFEDMQIGQTYSDCLVYIIDIIHKSSAKSNWVSVVALDKKRKVRKINIFWPEKMSRDFTGVYARCDLTMTEYGPQTKDLVIVESKPLHANPEIILAQKYLQNAIAEDAELVDYCNRTSILNVASSYNAKDGLEIGYEIVRMAMEVSYAKTVTNLIPEISATLVTRAVIASRGYLVSTAKQPYSKSLKNVMVLSRYPLGRDSRLTAILDDNDTKFAEKLYLAKVRDTCKLLVEMRNQRDFLFNNSKIWSEA